MRVAFFATMALSAFVLPAHGQQKETKKEPTEISVGVVNAERKPISKSQGFVGRVDAIERVEIRARVTGFLDEIKFKEGEEVKEGAPLYQIEKGLFQAAVGEAARKGTGGGDNCAPGAAWGYDARSLVYFSR